MGDLLQLPYELQIILVSGYLAYKLYTTSRDVRHRTEDIILQVLCFGLIGRMAVLAIGKFYNSTIPPANSANGDWTLVLAGAATIFTSLIAAIFWRLYGNPAFSWAMKELNIYRDDHEHTAWASVAAEKADWTYIQVHLADGRVLESQFGKLPEKPPAGRITIDQDGIAFYVTATYASDGSRSEQHVFGKAEDLIVTYLPRSQVSQIEIGWKPK